MDVDSVVVVLGLDRKRLRCEEILSGGHRGAVVHKEGIRLGEARDAILLYSTNSGDCSNMYSFVPARCPPLVPLHYSSSFESLRNEGDRLVIAGKSQKVISS